MAEIVFLSSPTTIGSKRLTPLKDTDIDCDCGYGPFAVHVFNVSSLAELSAGLQSCPSNAFMVRGDTRGERVIPYRRKDPRKNEFTGEPEHATLFPKAREIVQIDIDAKHLDIPVAYGAQERLAYTLEYLLPWWFAGVSVIVQLTANCRRKTGLRIRLWYIADRPVSDEECIAALEPCGADKSIYQPQGLIYVCDPTFDGIPDPFAGESRWVLVQGNTDVLPWHGPEPRTGSKSDYAPNDMPAEGRLIPEGNRHNELIRYVGQLARRGLPPNTVRDMVSTFNKTALAVPLNESELERTVYRSIEGWVASAPEREQGPREGEVVISLAAEKALRASVKRVRLDATCWRGEVAKLAVFVGRQQLSAHVVVREISKEGVGSVTTADIQSELDAQIALGDADVGVFAPGGGGKGVLADVMPRLKCADDTGAIVKSVPNMYTILSGQQFAFWLNTRTGETVVQRAPWVDRPRALKESDLVECERWLCEVTEWPVAPREPLPMLNALAAQRPHDPFKGWLEGLVWDGVPRMADAAQRLLGAAEKREQYFFAWWLISAVARTFEPGCKADAMIILEGEQGNGKTSFLQQLCGLEFYARLPHKLDAHNPRVVGALQGAVIMEVAELAALKRSEAEGAKEFIDQMVDNWLPNYAKVRRRNDARTCVFAGTTNHSNYLKDLTGNRRFWPIVTGAIDLPALRAERAQLWAEAVARYKAGIAWHPTKDELRDLGIVQAQQERVSAGDEVDALISSLEPLLAARRGEAGALPCREGEEWKWAPDGSRDAVQWSDFAGLQLGGKAVSSAVLGTALRMLGWASVQLRSVPGRPRCWRRKA